MIKKPITIIFTITILVLALSANVSSAISSPDDTVRVWVQYQPGQSDSVRRTLATARAQVHYAFPELDSYVVSLPKQALNGIIRNPNVVGVEEDVKRYPVLATQSTSLVEFASLTLDTIGGQTVPWGIDAVQAREVWDANRDGAVDAGAPTGADRTVCIIDTGYYDEHEDLPGVIDGYSQVDGDWTEDGVGHGSHVAGTINAVNNELGVVGVSPGVIDLYIIKIFTTDGAWTNASDLVDAINRCADAGANVISMSLSGTRPNGTEKRAFNNLYQQGILHVAAAANDGTTAYHYPASYDSVMSVAAIDSDLLVADFSQQNDQVEIAAPGVSVLSTVPFLDENKLTVSGIDYDAYHIEYAARGTVSGALVDGGLCDSSGSWGGKIVLCQRGVISFYDKVINVQNSGGAAAVLYNNEPGNFLGTLGEGFSSQIIALSLSQEDGQYLVDSQLSETAMVSSEFTWPASGYEAWDGTSMATPHVAGVAALIWSSNPSLTNFDIRNAMTSSALDLGTPGRDVAYGYGLVQAYDALLSLGGGGADTPPTVSITSPINSTTVSETVSFTADASDDVSVTQVEFLVDGNSLGVDANSIDGWSVLWDTTAYTDGSHTLTVIATDTLGQTGTDSVTVTVDNGGGPTDPITLSVVGFKQRGKLYADLTWKNAASSNIDVFVNGSLYATTANDGKYTTGILGQGGGSATFQVCEPGTDVCSNIVTVTW